MIKKDEFPAANGRTIARILRRRRFRSVAFFAIFLLTTITGLEGLFPVVLLTEMFTLRG